MNLQICECIPIFAGACLFRNRPTTSVISTLPVHHSIVIYAFVSAYAKTRFSHDEAHSIVRCQSMACIILRKHTCHGRIQRGGRGSGPPPPPNCQNINFCHVEIFRQTPSAPPPPPLRKVSGSAHACMESRTLGTFCLFLSSQ